jgi:hypothetical protein
VCEKLIFNNAAKSMNDVCSFRKFQNQAITGTSLFLKVQKILGCCRFVQLFGVRVVELVLLQNVAAMFFFLLRLSRSSNGNNTVLFYFILYFFARSQLLFEKQKP